MACATLKRNLDWESMSQLPAKRRRCAPFATGSSTSPGLKVSENRPSVFGESVSAPVKITPAYEDVPELQPDTRVCLGGMFDNCLGFNERMAQEIWNERKRLQRRRQLRLAAGAGSSSSGSEGDASPPHPNCQHPKEHSRALFTFKQVRMICERMLREQEMALRAEYESALSSKLAEQYEAFVRFNIDQVQRRPPAATCMPIGMDAEHHMHQDLVPSYLS